MTWSALIKGCRKLGVDPNSLTPVERRQVLDVLIDQAILATRAQSDPRSWTARDSAEYAALRDKLLLNTALNEALFEAASGYMDRGLGAGHAHAGHHGARLGHGEAAPEVRRLVAAPHGGRRSRRCPSSRRT